MNKTTKRYIVSSIITFLTAFATVVLASIDSLSLEAIKNGALVGLGFTAFRAGIKALLEYFLTK